VPTLTPRPDRPAAQDDRPYGLETIARGEDVSPSTRVRALEVLLRLAKTASTDDVEWARIVQRFGDGRE
jgi:hypothetical protein